jgi:4,5-dihydroxyphthalate decarboxylase
MEYESSETRALMGNDYWRYGVKDCRHEIDVMTRYAHEQGLTARRLSCEELFAASTFNMARI